MPWQSGSGGSGGGSGGGGPWGGGSGGSSGSGSGGGSGRGGGPWGGGGGNNGGGWGGGGWGGGGGNRPPDFEDVIRRGQERLRGVLPGGMGGARGLGILIAVAIVLWLASGFYQVRPGQQGVVLRFGEWVNQGNLAGPGLHWHLPWPIETSVTPNVEEIRQIEIGYRGNAGRSNDIPEESLMLTGDQNIIDIDFTVQWRVSNAGQFLFNIREPEATIKIAAESAIRETIGRTDIQPALTDARFEVADVTRQTLQEILNEYQAGIAITEINLQDVQPPEPVIDAFEDVQRARQDLDRLRNQADAYRNKVIPEARGEAQRMIQEAEAYRERLINEAQGEAQRFLNVYEAYLQNPSVTTRRMYLETVQGVLRDTEKVIMSGDSGAVPYLPLNELRGRQGTVTGPTGPQTQQ
ncbi:FtsH protease activity modulator HflK [Algihabitans sp.]|uniref:FtsH protease activity modulator HflK n=1 Tax=Algihabitans sp. TaxID=2821514 RepID=UPI003BAC785C